MNLGQVALVLALVGQSRDEHSVMERHNVERQDRRLLTTVSATSQRLHRSPQGTYCVFVEVNTEATLSLSAFVAHNLPVESRNCFI